MATKAPYSTSGPQLARNAKQSGKGRVRDGLRRESFLRARQMCCRRPLVARRPDLDCARGISALLNGFKIRFARLPVMCFRPLLQASGRLEGMHPADRKVVSPSSLSSSFVRVVRHSPMMLAFDKLACSLSLRQSARDVRAQDGWYVCGFGSPSRCIN